MTPGGVSQGDVQGSMGEKRYRADIFNYLPSKYNMNQRNQISFPLLTIVVMLFKNKLSLIPVTCKA